jgi:hypothetical protein
LHKGIQSGSQCTPQVIHPAAEGQGIERHGRTRARTLAEKAIAIEPRVDSFCALAWAWHWLEQPEEARKAVGRALTALEGQKKFLAPVFYEERVGKCRKYLKIFEGG